MMGNIGKLLALPVVISLSACASLPDLELGEQGKTVADIVQRVKCELREASRIHPEFVSEKWAASAFLTVTVVEAVGLAPTLKYSDPISGGLFSFSSGASANRKNTRIYNQFISVDLAALASDKEDPCDLDRQTNFDLTGNLGIVETAEIGMASTTYKGAVRLGSAKNDAFAQTITLDLTKSLSATGPTWALTHWSGPGSLGSASRQDIHSLQVAFAPPKFPEVWSAGGSKPSSAADKAREFNQLILPQQYFLQPLR